MFMVKKPPFLKIYWVNRGVGFKIAPCGCSHDMRPDMNVCVLLFPH